MEFTTEQAGLQRKMAATRDLAQRRLAVLHELSPGRGARVIEVGCGAGLLLREIALATGPHGLAVGIDLIPDQVAAARAAIAGVPAARADRGDASALDWPDGAFDAAVATHVLEYLDAPGDALTELRRVMKPGARLVILATNWDADFWHGVDAAVAAPVLSAWRAAIPWPNLPAKLGPMLAARGFGALRQVPLPVVNTSLAEDVLAPWMAKLIAAEAGRPAGPAWLEALSEADARGEAFYSSVPILTTATAI
ncbi:MAG: methyltransferase domain-containing protein [Pseudomonadota bacterium]